MFTEPRTSTVTTKGQVTIPVDYREELDIPPGTVVKLIMFDDLIIIDPKDKISKLRGSLKPYVKKKGGYNKKKSRTMMIREAVKRYKATGDSKK